MALLQGRHHRGKIDVARPHFAVGVLPAIVVMNMHVGEPGPEEPGQAVVEVRMPGVEGEPGTVEEPEIAGSPEVKKVHVAHVLEPESEREILGSVPESVKDLLNCRSASLFSCSHA